MLERQPLSYVKAGELMAYKHNGFWQCMDINVIVICSNF